MANRGLSGRAAIVTGGAGGIGRVLVEALVANGASVTIMDVDREALARLGHDLAARGLEAHFLPSALDVSEPAACAEALARTRERFGRVDILVNNAAIGMGSIRTDHLTELVEIHEVTPALWQRIINVNFSGAFYMTRAVMPALLDQGWGRVINVTTSFFTMLRAGFAPYGPAKAGLEAMSAAHAGEFAGTGVTVNVVEPGGPTDTPMIPHEADLARGELIPPEVIARPVVWLCSSAANEVTGRRYVAARWDPARPPAEAAAAAGSPIGWPELAFEPAQPGGRLEG